MDDGTPLLRELPSIDHLLKSGAVRGLLREHPRALVVKAARMTIEHYRERIRTGDVRTVDDGSIVIEIKKNLRTVSSLSLRPVINATGVVIHTNLGRAPLPKGVLDNVTKIAEGYSNLEYDLEKGARGKRYSHVRKIIAEITGAEDCLVVNNNAAAVLLCLGALAKGGEVIVSRGELVEIGGAFRIPDVMAQSGAILKEVGATNKTHPYDYENAVNENTALLLKVHRSNYRIQGFTEEVSIEELAKLGKKYDLPVMYDLGSGCLFDLRPFGIRDEPVVQEIVGAGVDVTTFSGDKLLGGPQAGIIVGKPEIIRKLREHPLTRALRIDKFTLSALEAIFMTYADMDGAKRGIPVLQMLLASEDSLKIKARRLAAALKKANVPADVKIAKDRSRAGGGALPEVEFVSWTVSVLPHNISPNAFEEGLRKGDPPVIGRIRNERFIFDVRTIKTSQIKLITEAAKKAAPGRPAPPP